MGINGSNHKMGHQSPESSHYAFSDYDHWAGNIVNKRPGSKMEWKVIGLIILDLLGITWGVKTIFERIQSIESLIVFSIIVSYMACRFYIRIKRDQVLLKKEMFEQMERERRFNKEFNQ